MFKQRDEIVKKGLAKILDAYTAPPKLDEEGQRLEVQDMVDALHRRIPSSVLTLDLPEFMEQVRVNVREKQRTRVWPTVPLVLDAVILALEQRNAGAGGDQQRLQWLARWIKEGRHPPGRFGADEIGLLVNYKLCTLHDMKEAGIALPKEFELRRVREKFEAGQTLMAKELRMLEGG